MEAALKEAAMPLARMLAKKKLSDPTHKYILADLYDMVNEVRDEQIAQARELICRLTSQPDFWNNIASQEMVAKCNSIIKLQQGIE